MYSVPGRLVQVFLQVTEQVWQPMHLSRCMTIATCALILKPIYLLQCSYDSYRIALMSSRSVVVETIAELGIGTDHMCRFQGNTCDTIMGSAAFLVDHGTRNTQCPVLGMVHICCSSRHAVCENDSCRYRTIPVVYLNPVVVFQTNGMPIFFIHPDDLPATE